MAGLRLSGDGKDLVSLAIRIGRSTATPRTAATAKVAGNGLAASPQATPTPGRGHRFVSKLDEEAVGMLALS